MGNDKIPQLTPDILRLAAKLLSEASEVFGRHGCNDFKLSKVAGFETKAARIALDRAYHDWNGDPAEHDPDTVSEIATDFALMSLCSEILLNAAGDPRPLTEAEKEEITKEAAKSKIQRAQVEAEAAARELAEAQARALHAHERLKKIAGKT
jgi:hypothetical protein